MKSPPVHPAADVFPMLGDAELRALADDIAAHGLRHPVVLFEGKVLDGRNRLRACALASIAPTFETLADCPSPTAYVVSANLLRRHLDESQRAMVGARTRPLFQEEADARRASGLKQNRHAGTVSTNCGERTDGPQGKSSAHVAKLVNTSAGSIERASRVLRDGAPELVAAVDAGEVSVSAAADVAKLPKAEQRRAVAEGRAKEVSAERRKNQPALQAKKASTPTAAPTPAPEAPKGPRPSLPRFDPKRHAAICPGCKVEHQVWEYRAEPTFEGLILHKWACGKCGRLVVDMAMKTTDPAPEHDDSALRAEGQALLAGTSGAALRRLLDAMRAVALAVAS